MKKLGIVAATLVLGSGVAFAASVAIPWFVDNAVSNADIPHRTLNASGEAVTTLVTLKSNSTDVLTCTILYFNQDGTALGPFTNNTFTIAPQSSLAFRPVRVDPGNGITGPNGEAGAPFGQEGNQGVKVPDRPRDVDTKFNGSITITFPGDERDLQGQVAVFETQNTNGNMLTMSYGHLMPPGKSS